MIESSAICVVPIALPANFALVTELSTIFALVTALSTIFAVLIVLSLGVPTLRTFPRARIKSILSVFDKVPLEGINVI